MGNLFLDKKNEGNRAIIFGWREYKKGNCTLQHQAKSATAFWANLSRTEGVLLLVMKPHERLTEILQRYHDHIETESNPSTEVCATQAQGSKYPRFIPCKDLLQIVESLTEILQRYHDHIETESNPSTEVCATQVQHSKYPRFIAYNDLLQIMERELDEPSTDELSVTDLVHLQEQFESALLETRATQTYLLLESVARLHEKEKVLEEEKTALQRKIEGSKGKKVMIDLNTIPEGSKSNAE